MPPVFNAAILIAAKLFIGWLCADLLGGFAHWLEDRVLPNDLPLIGPLIVEPNRLHHAHPMAFAAGNFLARNGTTWLAVGGVASAWLVLFGFSVVFVGAALGGAVSSMVHYWTHVAPKPGHPLRVLQDMGLIQSVAQHAQHHMPPSDRRYCPLTNFCNPVLDTVGAWGALERLFRIPNGRD
jgi:ubiquitin-conjugating enzyme E2 variant